MSFPDTTKCVRCDDKVSTEMGVGLQLTFNQELGAVKLCGECESVAKERDYFGYGVR